ncbi:flagellar hook-associated protein FlgK [Pseudooceanicola sp. C21-150M6]|uniref:flagellar hook-associated protein FlgK n=1 Tax=Pseudooceanicola sp. C21-150M6 TaxID=3434355 RepID=UPI003D7FED23
MSILSAINASRTGLMANSLRAELVSANIANAQNESYSRRTLDVTGALSGGVSILGVSRSTQTAMDAMFRGEWAAAAKQSVMVDSLTLYTTSLGEIDSETSLPGSLTAFENAMALLSNAPENETLQQQAVSAGRQLATALQSASGGLSQMESRALSGIETDVEAANDLMENVVRLNRNIAATAPGSNAYAALQDEMGATLDSLAEVMGIQVQYDEMGRAEVYTEGGVELVKGLEFQELAYNRTTQTLTAGNENITPGASGRRGFDSGTLAGHIELMTETVPQMQLELDEMARALIEGFEAADTSLAAGDPGLFTDAGAAYNAANLEGLAGRITVNAAVDPTQGGDLWRIRDGMSAVTEGAASDPTQLLAFVDIFSATTAFDPAAGQGSTNTLSEFTSGIFAKQQNVRVDVQASLTSLSASAETYRAARLDARGVNIDTELQNLTLVEQAYNANSQALKTAIEMIDTLLAAV